MADIHVSDVEENPDAPQPQEMIDLEVGILCREKYMGARRFNISL